MRKWIETISPKSLHDNFGIYNGEWMKQMDRCWNSDDNMYQVTSRLLITEWGKVEHAVINKIVSSNDDTFLSSDGSRDIPWAEKQAIKNELFGKDRVAIEVFPEDKHLVDVADCYHLWILPKGFKMPFGIHPLKDVKCKVVNRGVPKDLTSLANNTKMLIDNKNNN